MSTAGKIAWGVVLLVGIVHFDFWWWDDDTLVLGFVPLALAFHALLSTAAALGWALVVWLAWPEGIEAWAGQAPDEPAAGPRSAGASRDAGA